MPKRLANSVSDSLSCSDNTKLKKSNSDAGFLRMVSSNTAMSSTAATIAGGGQFLQGQQ